MRSMLTMRILPKRLGKWNWKMILSWVSLTSPRGLRRKSITNIFILPYKKKSVSLQIEKKRYRDKRHLVY